MSSAPFGSLADIHGLKRALIETKAAAGR